MAGQVNGGHLEIGNLDTFGIFVFVQLGAHLQTGIGCRRRDQLDDGTIAAQRLASPVDRDERKKAVLDFVPLARAGWQVANRDGELELVCQLLKLDFPETHTIPVAAATVSRDHQTFGFGMTLHSHRPPPSADRVDGKGGGVVIRADADPPDIVGDVVDAIRYRTTQLGVDEIVDVDLLRRAVAPPFAAVVLEIAYQFLLFCINRNDWLVCRQKRLGLGIDVIKLRVAIDVLAAFSCLAVRLQCRAEGCRRPSGRPYALCSPARSRDYASCGSSTTAAASDRPASRARPTA